MDADSPTTATDHLDVPERPRSRSVLGLPTRLALLVLAAIAIFVVALLAYADHRLADSRSTQAREVALGAAGDLGSQLTASDFDDGNDDFTKLLADRLDVARQEKPSIERIALFARGVGSKVTLRTSSGGTSPGSDASLAAASVRSGDPEFGTAGSNTTVAWPISFDDGTPGAVAVIEYDTSATLAGGATDRTRLVLGGIIAGALLGAIVLLLLRREMFRPLEEMRRVMSQIRGGAHGVRIGWSRGDELGAVADEFDAMVSELEAAQSELAKYVNRDPLTGLLTREAFTDRFAAELTRARREGYPIALLAIDIDDLDEVNRTHDRAAGDQVLADIGSVIGGCTRPTDACGRTGDDSFHVALVGADAEQASIVIERVRREIAQRVGIGPERTRVTCGYGVAEYPRHAVDQIALERMSEAACHHAQRDGRDRALAFGPAGGYVESRTLVPESERSAEQPTGARELSSTVHALARALDGIDPALGGSAHSQRVARYAAALARELGYGDSALRELRSAAVLHDVGKVAVPPSILRTPEEQLDERQRGALRYHAWVSRTMIAGAGLGPVADIVFHVPERWDGTGYPERQREDAIPEASRILHAAELLDQLVTGHAGAPAMSPFRAASELKRRAGSELDPDLAVRLARLVREEGLVGNEQAVPERDAAPAKDAEAA